MDAEVVTKLMVSQQLLSEDIVMAASSDYLKNTLVLGRVRLMCIQSLMSFGQLLQSIDSQKHIGAILIKGSFYESSIYDYRIYLVKGRGNYSRLGKMIAATVQVRLLFEGGVYCNVRS